MVVGGQRRSPTALPAGGLTGAENLAHTGIRSPDRPARNQPP